MYKIFARPCGSHLAPSSESYEILQVPPGTSNLLPRVIFDASTPDISKYVSDPQLELSAAEAGKLTLSVYTGHPFYSKLKPYATELLVYEEDTCIWIGRIIDVDINLVNTLSITAEGALAYFNDIYVQGKNDPLDVPIFWSMRDIFEEYILPALTDANANNITIKNSYMPAIVVISDNIGYSDGDSRNRQNITMRDGVDYLSIKALMEEAVTSNGGYYYVQYEPLQNNGSSVDGTIATYLYYKNSYPAATATYYATAGINITELNKDYNIDEFATAIYPLGARLTDTPSTYNAAIVERYDIHSATTVPSGFSRYTNSTENRLSYLYDATAVSEFGWIEKVVTYDDLTDPDDIIAEAAKDLALCLAQSMSTSISFNALTNNTAQHLPRLYDNVMINAPYNSIVLTSPIQILDLSVNLARPWESQITLTASDYKKITKLIK